MGKKRSDKMVREYMRKNYLAKEGYTDANGVARGDGNGNDNAEEDKVTSDEKSEEISPAASY